MEKGGGADEAVYRRLDGIRMEIAEMVGGCII